MSKVRCCFIGVAICFSLVWGGEERSLLHGEPLQQEGEPTFQVEEHLNAWVNLWRTYDLNLVDNLFLRDPRVTYLSSEKEGLIIGFKAVREHHVGFGFVEGGKTPEKELWLENTHSTQFGSVAVVTAVWFFGQRDKPDAQRGPVTFVYVLDGGEFKLAHLNFGNYE